MNFLITGQPGVGKTTVIKRVASELEDLNPAGFYTEEIREKGVRIGFSIKTLGKGKKEGVLAHVDIKGVHRVGRYGVDITGFEEFLRSIDLLNSPGEVVLMDEIGRMECFSGKFLKITRALLDSPKTVVATIASKGGGFIEEVKKRGDCEVFHVDSANRDTLPSVVADRVRGTTSIR